MEPLNLDYLRTELYARIDEIHEPSIHSFTRRMTDLAPDGFWEKPSSRNHHPVDERQPHGNVLHTIRTLDAFDILAETQSFTQMAKDVGHSALVIHDQYKHGINADMDSSVADHPLIPRRVARKNGLVCMHFLMIMNAVERHMGK